MKWKIVDNNPSSQNLHFYNLKFEETNKNSLKKQIEFLHRDFSKIIDKAVWLFTQTWKKILENRMPW